MELTPICWGITFYATKFICVWNFLFIFSYEIIHQFGGIYLDTDSQSLKPFDSLFQHSFVCYDAGWNTLVHSVFGMPPKSKFLRFALESARLNFQHEEFRKRIVYLRYGPTFLGKMFFEFHDSTINIIDSRYLIWNQNNNENYMIQVKENEYYLSFQFRPIIMEFIF